MTVNSRTKRSILKDSTNNYQETNIETFWFNQEISYQNKYFRLYYRESTNSERQKKETTIIKIYIQNNKSNKTKLHHLWKRNIDSNTSDKEVKKIS